MTRFSRPAILCAFSLLAAAPAYSATAYTGTLSATFSIKLVTPPPSGANLICTLDTNIIDEKTSGTTVLSEIFTEISSSVATISGSSASCTVLIPYSWLLNNAAGDKINISYSIGYINTSGGVSSLTQLYRQTSSSTAIPAIPVPSMGWLIDLPTPSIVL
jgi:hypothetical protein